VVVPNPTEGLTESTALSNLLDKAEDDTRALFREANTVALSFGGLGLRLADNTRAWAIKKLQMASGFHFFLDCFSLLEWVLTLNTGADNLAKLKAVKNMRLATLAEANAMNSLNSAFIGSDVVETN
jgi:hypothetical protein